MRLFSNSAILPMRVMNILPIGPLVSMASLAEMNSTPSSCNSSTISRKFLVLRATRSNAATIRTGELTPTSIHQHGIQPRALRLGTGDPSVAVFFADLEASQRRQLSEVVQLRLDMLVWCAYSCVKCGSFHINPS